MKSILLSILFFTFGSTALAEDQPIVREDSGNPYIEAEEGYEPAEDGSYVESESGYEESEDGSYIESEDGWYEDGEQSERDQWGEFSLEATPIGFVRCEALAQASGRLFEATGEDELIAMEEALSLCREENFSCIRLSCHSL